MKKLSQYRDDEALEVLADILEPACIICADEEFQKSLTKSKMEIAQVCLKNHPKEIRQIMAVLDGVPFEDYHIGLLDAPIKCIQIMNDKELMDFFRSQGQMALKSATGSATENTEEEGLSKDSSIT